MKNEKMQLYLKLSINIYFPEYKRNKFLLKNAHKKHDKKNFACKKCKAM